MAPYAWFTLGQAFLTTAVTFGVWFSFAIFFVALVEDFGWSHADASLAFSLGNLLQAALAPLVGVLTDRLGARRIVSTGLGLMALALAGCSHVQTLWHFLVFFGLGIGGGVALAGPVAHSALLANWFVRQRGAVLGFAFAGMGIGVQLVGPLVQQLILLAGWRQSFIVLAVSTAIYAVFVALTLRQHPHQAGLEPYGASQPDSSQSKQPTTVYTPLQSRRLWTVHEALKTREFWALALAQVLIPAGILPIAAHQVAYLVDAGFSKVMAAAILGYMGFMSACGRMAFGALSDRLGRFGSVTLSVLCSQIGIVVLLGISDAMTTWPLYLYALFFGVGYGARGPIISALTADLFPGRHFGTIFGLMSIGHGIGGALGPWYGGYVYDRLGTYTSAFVVALLALCGVIGCFWLATRRLATR